VRDNSIHNKVLQIFFVGQHVLLSRERSRWQDDKCKVTEL